MPDVPSPIRVSLYRCSHTDSVDSQICNKTLACDVRTQFAPVGLTLDPYRMILLGRRLAGA